jgi:hypothetical protein
MLPRSSRRIARFGETHEESDPVEIAQLASRQKRRKVRCRTILVPALSMSAGRQLNVNSILSIRIFVR